MMKKTRALTCCAILLFVLCMGADNPFQSSSRAELSKRIELLERQNAELRQQVTDLSMKVEVLTQRVNASCGPGSSSAFNSDNINLNYNRSSVPGLATVRLAPEAPKDDKPKGRLIVTNSDPEATVLIEHGTGAPLPATNYVPLPDPELTMPTGSGGDAAKSPDAPAAAAPMATAAPAPAPAPAPSKDEASAFNSIKDLLDQGKNDEAVPLMEDYLNRYPKGAHEDKVAFWLGVSYFNKNEHDKAIKTLRIVSENHAESEEAPNALLRIGLAYLELGRTDEAGEAFREIKILYPFSDLAQKAEEMLSSCCP